MQGTVVKFLLDTEGILENYLLLYLQYRYSGLYCDLHVNFSLTMVVVFGLHHSFGFGVFFVGNVCRTEEANMFLVCLAIGNTCRKEHCEMWKMFYFKHA